MKPSDLQRFAAGYSAAWSSQDSGKLASFYTADGVLVVNGGEPAEGRAAVAARARSFMEAFPDMVVALDHLIEKDDAVEFHWIWTGTNTGPGGTGNAVRLKGYEEWTFAADGLIAKSDGHYDAAEYRRQVQGNAAAEDAGVAAAEAWLGLVDRREYAASWKEAAAYFRNAVSQQEWKKTLEGVRSALGEVVSRTLDNASYQTSLPGAPDGEYVIVKFRTEFRNKKEAIETVIPMKEEDGAWRVSGYFIR